MRSYARCWSLLILLLLNASPAAAQFGVFEGLAKRVTDVGMFITVGDRTPSWSGQQAAAAEAPTGIGLEVLFEIGRVRRGPAQAPDTVFKPVEATITRRGFFSADTVKKYNIEIRPVEQDAWVLFELGLGYSENGFKIEGQEFEARGALRELPMVSLYGNIWTNLLQPVPRVGDVLVLSPYVGVRAGLISLAGLRAYTPPTDSASRTAGLSKVLKGSGDAFRIGGFGGFVTGVGPVNIFFEAEYGRRTINSVQWEADIPSGLPRDLKFEKWLFLTGFQIGFGSLLGGTG